MTHESYMLMALQEAEKGVGWVSPNPLVGAVIVKEGRVIGKGYHARHGEAHAERNALASCTEAPAGADMYVTLEPCCHHGRQPPCTEAILAAGIRRVFVGATDPNPLMAGKGIALLRAGGVEVVEHLLREECERLCAVFFHYIQTKTPFVVMKYAMTLDGKIAAHTGASQWITGEAARAHVHTQRHRYRAIMVGVGTVLADDPLLTCRMESGRNPIRLICDTHLRTPPNAQVVTTAHEVPTIIATCQADTKTHQPYLDAGCRMLVVAERDGHVDLPALMKRLGEETIDSVLLEGGGTLNWAALESGIVQRVLAYVAPKLLGGEKAKTPVAGSGFPTPQEAVRLKRSTVTPLGEDFLIEGEVDDTVYGNC